MIKSHLLYIIACYGITFVFLFFSILVAWKEHHKIINDISRKKGL